MTMIITSRQLGTAQHPETAPDAGQDQPDFAVPRHAKLDLQPIGVGAAIARKLSDDRKDQEQRKSQSLEAITPRRRGIERAIRAS